MFDDDDDDCEPLPFRDRLLVNPRWADDFKAATMIVGVYWNGPAGGVMVFRGKAAYLAAGGPTTAGGVAGRMEEGIHHPTDDGREPVNACFPRGTFVLMMNQEHDDDMEIAGYTVEVHEDCELEEPGLPSLN